MIDTIGGNVSVKRLPVHESIVRFTRQTANEPEPNFLAPFIKDIRVMMLDEAIIRVIRRADTDDELEPLARFIKETEILKGHDEIITAWIERLQEEPSVFYLGVVEDLLSQREEARKRLEAPTGGVSCW